MIAAAWICLLSPLAAALAITLGNEYEISEYSRDDLIYTKDMLLAPPIKRIPVADPAEFDTPIPYYHQS